MARITEKEIHGVMTEVIEMDAPADELEDALRAQIAAEQAIESAETAQDAAERAEEAALRAEGNIAGVSSFNGRYGAVLPQSGDYTPDMIGAATETEYTATVGTTWTERGEMFEQTIPVDGITLNDNPIVDVVLSDDDATSLLEESAYINVHKIITYNNSIMVVSRAATDIEYVVRLKVVK